MNDQDFIINLGPQGTFQRSGDYQTLPEDIDKMFSAFEEKKQKKFAIYFHGGLVNETEGLTGARKIAPELLKSGCAPICFVWETGLIETISTNVSKLGQTSFFQDLLKYLLKKLIGKIGIEEALGRGQGSMVTDDFILSELEKREPFKELNHTLQTAQARGDGDLDALAYKDMIGQLENDLLQEIQLDYERNNFFKVDNLPLSINNEDGAEGSRSIFRAGTIIIHIAKIAYKVIKRFINSTDHGLYPTIIEEILRKFYLAEVGAWVWKGMKDKSSEMWGNNVGRTGHQQYGGRYFLDRLYQYLEKFPDTEINLVGHSAGSIAICNLFLQTRSKPIFFNHILFMAPACRTQLFKSAMMVSQKRFKDLRVFTMTDENECNDVLVPYFYTRSLLYLISGVLEEEGKADDANILGLERHISFSSPHDTDEHQDLHEYLYENEKNRLCYSKTKDGSVEGLRTHSLKHGDFDDDELTVASLVFILKN